MEDIVSAREEDYLKAIYRLEVGGPVPPGELVARLGVSGAAVSRMTARLAEEGLVRRTAYQGVMLTDAGRHHALRVLRHHRLIEVWLTETLGYGWEEVDTEAEILEHALSVTLANRLEESLGYPRTCPHGDPIPTRDLTLAEVRERPLTTIPVGYPCLISRVAGDAAMLKHLRESGLVPGVALTVVDRSSVGGLMTVQRADELLPIASVVAAALFVRRPEEGAEPEL